MNKKQLIIAWVIGIRLCLAWLDWDSSQNLGGEYKRGPRPDTKAALMTTHAVTLIIGGLLIYTLRDKKK